MALRRRPGKRIIRSLLPILLLLVLALGGATIWIVYTVARPARRSYLVTPEKFTQLSARGVKATEETWPNMDGTTAHGWLLRGAEGAPAVVLLHRYGADRSWLLNLGVKLNETTNFTILWPDQRGHGENPTVRATSFGIKEAEDAAAALDYLRSLRNSQRGRLVGDPLGIYGVEMGGYAALKVAAGDGMIQALVLDSLPSSPDDLLRSAVRDRLGIDNRLMQALARMGVRIYLMGRYENTPTCTVASYIKDRSILLLSGEGAGHLKDSTIALRQCLEGGNEVQIQTDLPLTGYNLHPSTGEQEEAYDRRVIEFFNQALRRP